MFVEVGSFGIFRALAQHASGDHSDIHSEHRSLLELYRSE